MPKGKDDIKLLLVEEDIKSRNNRSSRLRMQGLDVEAATSGAHAIHLIERNEYSLVIIVDNMNDMPGIEVVALTRSFKSKEEAPILFISESNQQEDILKILDFEANDCINKSSDFNIVLNKIKELT